MGNVGGSGSYFHNSVKFHLDAGNIKSTMICPLLVTI